MPGRPEIKMSCDFLNPLITKSRSLNPLEMCSWFNVVDWSLKLKAEKFGIKPQEIEEMAVVFRKLLLDILIFILIHDIWSARFYEQHYTKGAGQELTQRTLQRRRKMKRLMGKQSGF